VSDGAIREIALVGAGPIGLEMAVALKRGGLDYAHLERGQVGETITRFPLQMRFFSSNDRIALAGLPLVNTDQSKATREEYLAYLRQVITHFGLEVRTHTAVTDAAWRGDHYLLAVATAAVQEEIRARRLILALGGTHRPRRLGIPGEDLPHVHHAFVEPHRYFGRRVLIVGGKNSAGEAALRCWHAGAKVALSYRREAFAAKQIKYWLQPELEGRLDRGEIEGHLGTVPVAIEPGAVRLRRNDGSEVEVAADFVLVLIGFEQDRRLFDALGVETAGEAMAPVFDPDTMRAGGDALPGLYVIGTATAGEQRRFAVFLENCHVHVDRVLAHLRGEAPPPAPVPEREPES
jgi:thioredoxin reductase (NADPH)